MNNFRVVTFKEIMEILSHLILLIFTLLLSRSAHVSSKVYNIAPTQYECNNSCLTLSQFAQNYTGTSTSNATVKLFISGENHSLDVGFSISNITEIIMQYTNHISNPVITCTGQAKFEFTNISNVWLNGLNFERCNGSSFKFIHELTIENSTFSESPITIADSKVNFMRTGFYLNSGSSQGLSECSDQPIRASLGGALLVTRSVVAIENCNFVGNTANFGGAIYSKVNSSITIIDSNFTNNHAGYNSGASGGAIFINESVTVIVSNTTFLNNTSEFDGGVATIINAALSFLHSSIHMSKAIGHGGAVAAFENSNLTLKSSRIHDNIAEKDGGAVYLQESNITISDCNISNNNANGDGGAIYGADISSIKVNASVLNNNKAQKGNGGALCGQNSSIMAVTGCDFINNTAVKDGGVVWINFESVLHINSSNFTGNNASMNGGVAFILNKSVISIKACNMSKNWAYDYGGAVFVKKCNTVNISDCTFTDNNANYGGALDVYDQSNAIISSCNFNGNNVTTDGAAIYIDFDCAATISSSTFSWNKADDDGGAVYGKSHCNISIRSSKFCNNMAENSGAGVFIGDNSTAIIDNCTFRDGTADYGAAVVAHIRSVVIIVVSVFQQNRAVVEGGALHAYRGCSMVIQNSTFTLNLARFGGVCLVLLDCRLVFQDSVFFNNSASFGGVIGLIIRNNITIFGGIFAYNNALLSGGVLYAQLGKIVVNNTTFELNGAKLFGGVIHAIGNCIIIINKITFMNNTADDGGVLSSLDNSIGFIKHSNFIYNRANDTGGVIYLNKANLTVSHSRFTLSNAYRHGGVILATVMSVVRVAGSNFSHNTARFGAALAIEESSSLLFTFCHNVPQFGVEIPTCSDLESDEILIYNNTALMSGGGIYLTESSLCIQTKTSIFFNNAREHFGGGIHASHLASIIVENTVRFVSNKATSGGGLSLSYSKLYDTIDEDMTKYSNMSFVSNQADYGGALYLKFNKDDEITADVCSGEYSSTSGCFFQNVSDTFIINFDNNHAKYEGQDLFGGLLDRCKIANGTSTNHSLLESDGIARFKSISDITSLKTIGSKPVRVCLCENSTLNCSTERHSIQVKHKSTILLPLAAVDQVANVVTATIQSHVKDFNLSENEATQTIGPSCSSLKYHIMALPRAAPYQATIYADGPCGDKGISKLTIDIDVVPCTCAPGFEVDDNDEECKCGCDPYLLNYGYIKECDPERESVKRNGLFWISITNMNDGNFSYLFFPYCPMGYCQPPTKSIHVNLNHHNGSDTQCANNHSGLLCGKCQPNHSISLGSSKCVQCHNEWHGQLIGITMAALFAGIFLVVFILVLNLTVAVGTMNSIIFYANIVYSSRILTQSQLSSVFISWLNLNIGFDVCFYDGMDAYVKTWLELAFPAYIIILVLAIIWISSCSSTFSNLIGKRNPVATLATLILVSYAKVVQTIIITFSFVKSTGSIMPRTRWLYDASIVYFGWKHALLFGTAVLILVLGLFYTIILFSWQWLLHCPRSKVFVWTKNQKFHSFVDTYHTPHTAKHRYWTGLRLLVRVILYLIAAFSSSVYADPHIPVLATIVVISCLLLFKTVMMIKVYRNWLLNAMDTFMYFNIVIPAIFTLHPFTDQSLQLKVINVSVGITIVLFCFIVAFHVYRYGSVKLYTYCRNTKLYKHMTEWLSFLHSQEKSSSSPSDGRLLDVLDSLRQDEPEEIYDQHDKPTSSEVSLVHSEESPSSDYCLQLNEEVNQSDYQLNIDKGNRTQQKSCISVNTQREPNNAKKIELPSYFCQDDNIRKPLLEESL